MALNIWALFATAASAITVFAFVQAGHSFSKDTPRHHYSLHSAKASTHHNSDSIARQVLSHFDADRIKQTLHLVTKQPHVAGTVANHEVGDKLAELWRGIGLEDVHFLHYDVLLSYPNYTQPNAVAILDVESGAEVWKNRGVSPVVIPEEQGAPGAGVQWLAYSADTGGENVVGEPVYCHYGTPADFRQLAAMNVSVAGKIAVMRFNTGFRGNKVFNAQQAGAIGAILYSDPMEYAREGTAPANVYPSTVWMPPHGVQRGTVVHELLHGDPLTPNYPAKPEFSPVSRSVENARDTRLLPRIPALPMSYADAYEILSRMRGPVAPANWQGGLNITYRVGPGFATNTSTHRVGIRVNSLLEQRPIRNLVGYIHGVEEPDEYVMLGNHYDAWVYGSLDPNSGTAVLAEVARAMLRTANETGWRPKRTLMFLAWDAEEHGIIGSTEFVEEFAQQLDERAVVYLNLDLLSNNQSLEVKTVPTLYQAVVEAAKKVPTPMESERLAGRPTLYDTWLHYFPPNISWLPDYPMLDAPGGGSDHAALLNYVGLPVASFTYRNASSNSYGLYHTMYETPFVNEHLFDTNNFAVHKAIGRFWARLALAFADATIYPFNVSVLARRLHQDYVPELERAMGQLTLGSSAADDDDELKLAKQQLDYLLAKCREFVGAAAIFEQMIRQRWGPSKSPSKAKAAHGPPTKKMKHVVVDSRLSARQVNSRLKRVDRCFIKPQGVDPSTPIKRHMLFSLSASDSYHTSVLAPIYDQLDHFRKSRDDPLKRKKYARRVAEEIAAVLLGVHCAINEMRPVI